MLCHIPCSSILLHENVLHVHASTGWNVVRMKIHIDRTCTVAHRHVPCEHVLRDASLPETENRTGRTGILELSCAQSVPNYQSERSN